jgi:hypothetical protein
MKQILYVTSFAEDMYNASGKNLIKSFINTNQNGNLLICYENFNYICNNEKIFGYDLFKNDFLQNWLYKYKHIIPNFLGGTATEINNPKVFDSANRKASRWFRKIAALHYALNTYKTKYDYIIWIDSDCEFRIQIPIQLIINNLNLYDFFFYLGKKRFDKNKGIEAGFLGFNINKNGSVYLNKVFDYFTSGDFIKEIRWDDGYIFRKILQYNHVQFNYNDLVKSSNKISVMEEGPFANYIIHNKGFHKRLNIML